MKLKLCFMLLCTMPSISMSSTLVLNQYDMTLELANKLATETINQCQKYGKNGVVSVVDRGGNLVLVMRDNNVGPHNTIASQRKAYTSLSTKTETRMLMKKAQSDSESSNLNTINELLLLGGGVPVKYNNEVIGAIGVAGMGGSEFDEKCAIQAIKKIDF